MTIREVNPKNQNGPAGPATATAAPQAPVQLNVPKAVADALRKHDLVPDGMHKSDAVLRLLGALEKGGFRSQAAQDPFAQLTFGIRAFQSQNKLKATGRVDDATAALLNATLLAPPPEDPAETKKKKPDGFEK